MIKQDQSKKPAWLSRFAEHGSYVPRFFFLNPDGSLNKTLTSGHPRYPFFFASQQLIKLKTVMQKAAGS